MPPHILPRNPEHFFLAKERFFHPQNRENENRF
jgi:hypothetical protein